MTNAEKARLDANRLSSLTYMISACLVYSIDGLFDYLAKANLRLAGRDKMLFNRVKEQIGQLQGNLKILEDLAFNVMGNDDEAKLAYEDAVHIYWVIFLVLVDRGGSDELCDLRFKALVDIIGKYESLLHLPGLDRAYFAAFAQVSKAIQEGKYSKEDFKNLLKVHEDRTEETEGEILGEKIFKIVDFWKRNQEFLPGTKLTLNNENGVVIDEEKNGLYGTIRWDTNKQNDFEEWSGLIGTFFNYYSYTYINS